MFSVGWIKGRATEGLEGYRYVAVFLKSVFALFLG